MAEPRESRGVLRAAGAMGIGTFFSRIMGLVREQAFAFLFGAGNATDAFNIAFRIPNLLRDLFAEGAMSAALVPTFTRVRTQEGDRRSWRVAGLVFRVLLGVVSVLAIAGLVFAPELVSLYASAFRKVPGKFELTVNMTRIMFPFFPLVALAAAFMGILNACGRFFIPAFSSALFNLVSVFTGVAFSVVLPRFGIHPIQGMAIGVVLGGAAQAFCQLPLLYKAGYRWVPRASDEPVWHKDPALRRMLIMMVPGTVGLAATQVNILVNSVLATSQGPGAVSWLNYAFRLMQFPIGILGVSLAAATLPRVSRLWVDRDLEGVQGQITQSLRHVFAVNLPASAGLAFLGVPIIQLIFEHGRFGYPDTLSTARALAAYALGLTAYSAVKVLVPACYAMGNTRVPVISSIFSVVATIILNLIMIKPFGYVGLALGTSFAALLNAGQLLWAIRAILRGAGGNFDFRGLAKCLLLNLLSAIVMGVSVYLSWRLLDRWVFDALFWPHLRGSGVFLVRLFKATLVIAEGGVLWLAMGRVLRIREVEEIFDLFASRVKKKLNPVAK